MEHVNHGEVGVWVKENWNKKAYYSLNYNVIVQTYPSFVVVSFCIYFKHFFVFIVLFLVFPDSVLRSVSLIHVGFF